MFLVDELDVRFEHVHLQAIGDAVGHERLPVVEGAAKGFQGGDASVHGRGFMYSERLVSSRCVIEGRKSMDAGETRGDGSRMGS